MRQRVRLTVGGDADADTSGVAGVHRRLGAPPQGSRYRVSPRHHGERPRRDTPGDRPRPGHLEGAPGAGTRRGTRPQNESERDPPGGRDQRRVPVQRAPPHEGPLRGRPGHRRSQTSKLGQKRERERRLAEDVGFARRVERWKAVQGQRCDSHGLKVGIDAKSRDRGKMGQMAAVLPHEQPLCPHGTGRGVTTSFRGFPSRWARTRSATEVANDDIWQSVRLQNATGDACGGPHLFPTRGRARTPRAAPGGRGRCPGGLQAGAHVPPTHRRSCRAERESGSDVPGGPLRERSFSVRRPAGGCTCAHPERHRTRHPEPRWPLARHRRPVRQRLLRLPLATPHDGRLLRQPKADQKERSRRVRLRQVRCPRGAGRLELPAQGALLLRGDGLVRADSIDATPAPGRRLFVYFGAANYDARVYVDGRLVGRHVGGFTPFNFEITSDISSGDNSSSSRSTTAGAATARPHRQHRLVELRRSARATSSSSTSPGPSSATTRWGSRRAVRARAAGDASPAG